MSFVNLSLLLLGSLFVAVPLVLHMAMRQKPRSLAFPAMRFLRQREATNRRRLQWRQWLLLAARCLLVLLMALALARPSVTSAELGPWLVVGILALLFLASLGATLLATIQRRGAMAMASLGLLTLGVLAALGHTTWSMARSRSPLLLGDQKAAVAAVVLLDTSPRMLYAEREQTRLQRAQEITRWLLRQLPQESEVAIMDSGPAPPAFAVDRGAANLAVDTLEPTYVPQPWSRRWEQAMALLAGSPLPRKELYVVSDLSRGTWDDLEQSSIANRLAEQPEIDVQLVDVGSTNPANDAIQSLELSQATYTPGTPFQLDVRVQRQGTAGTRNLELYLEPAQDDGPLVVDGKLQTPAPEARGSQALTLDPSVEATARFNVAPLEPGTHHGFVQLVGEDPLQADNRRYFSLLVREPWTLRLAAGAGAEASLLTEWLAPLELREADRAKFRCQIVPMAEVDKDLAADAGAAPTRLPTPPPTGIAAIGLLDPPPLQPSQWAALRTYVQNGGGLAVFLGRNADSAAAFNNGGSNTLLPAPLERQWRDDAGVALAPRDYDHPMLAVFRNVRESVPWEALPVYRHWVVGPFAPQSRSILDFDDGKPAVLERTLGKGRVVLMTTPVTDADDPQRPAWNALPTSLDSLPAFVLIDRLFLYLAQANDAPLNHVVGQPASLPAPGGAGERLTLFTPRGDWTELTANEGQVSMPFTDQPGIYRLRTRAGIKTAKGFSVNLAAGATRLERLDAPALERLLGPGRARLAANEDQIVRGIDEVRIGREFYPFLMPVIALVLALEYIVSNRFYSQGTDQ